MARLEERLGVVLRERHLTVCTAESCTGGLVASRITDVAGSSAYMWGGVISYSNRAKMDFLGVDEATLVEHGAVSEPTAREMAQRARAIFGADYALSVTGIAGPSGGTADKPVGLTYIGLAGPDGLVVVQRHVWQGDRLQNKANSVDAALKLLLETVE